MTRTDMSVRVTRSWLLAGKTTWLNAGFFEEGLAKSSVALGQTAGY
ncbi:hypothetical protein [Streptomyces sp. NBC_00038]|nr:hypothetical protein [Streptomyces sp. NBC_00038]MCX5554518.1 hypothetical protein [Streptomyces sp. NBC_00038]